MIKSDAQLNRTKEQIKGFERAIEEITQQSTLSSEIVDTIIASHKGLIAKLEDEIEEYELIKQGVIKLPRISNVRELGVHLIKFRIALNITQEQLAEMVGTTRQTINKHEEQEYQLASVAFISQVSEALGIQPEILVKHKTLDVKQPMCA